MATLLIKDGGGTARYLQVQGAGTLADPYISDHRLTNENGNGLGVDTSTRVQIGIDYAHHEIHDGSMFEASVNSSASDFDTGDELWIAFKTPNATKELHAVIESTVTGACMFKFIEAPTIALDAGTARVAYCHNLDLANTATIISNETVPQAGFYNYNEDAAGGDVTAGTTIIERTIGAGKDKVGGEARSSEWILKKNTLYAFVLVAQADNIRANIAIDFYEHTPKTD